MSEYISQELAKRLQAKGFRAEHGNVWIKNMAGGWSVSMKELNCQPTAIPAYTFTELWAVLPDEIEIDDAYINTVVLGKVAELTCIYYHGISQYGHHHESPAEAVGLMVEWLIDNGHMEVE